MARTQFNAAEQIPAGSITRAMQNTATAGAALILKLIAGSGVSLTSTGADPGTGDVTISMTGGGSSLDAFRNRLINGGMGIDQRNNGAAKSITAGAALAYTVDRWYAACTGANVTGQQVANSGVSGAPSLNAYQFTGAAGVTSIMLGQRIEAADSFDLAGSTATLSANLANSLLTTVTWTAYYANSANAFGTLASPTRTQIATGTFTVNTTLARYSAQINVPAAATTGIEVVLSVGAQTSGTWTIGAVQLEPGAGASTFDIRPDQNERGRCYRFAFVLPASSIRADGGVSTGVSDFSTTVQFPVPMRATPTVSGLAWTQTNCNAPIQNVLTSLCVQYEAASSGSGGGNFINSSAVTYSAEL